MTAPQTPRIVEIVLTGGSCAGKTESLGKLASMIRHDGCRVITVPEVATMIISGGGEDIGTIAREDGDAYCRFQREVFVTHRGLRRSARAMAEASGDPVVVILYDRGELDGMAYHNHGCFDQLAAEDGTTVDGIRDSYAAVMHLVTTAEGAEDFYSKANNSARWDNAQEARRFDAKVMRAWGGHANHIILDNSTDYAGKLERLLQSALRVIDGTGQLHIDLGGGMPRRDVEEMELVLDGRPQRDTATAP